MTHRFSILFTSGLLLAACEGGTPVSTDLGTNDSPIPTMQTAIEVAYIALDDNGANGPLVGCGDSEVFAEETVDGTLNAKERVQTGLEMLFANKEQFMDDSGLYNAVYQSDLQVDSIVITNASVDVALSGETMLGGMCDGPRFVEQIRGTVENNIESEVVIPINITINEQALEKIQDLSGR